MRPTFALIASLAGVIGPAALLHAQPDPSGIQFVTVGSPGNAPWTGGGNNNNRGEVDYSFRIGQYEVTTAQWVEFMNAVFDRPASDRILFVVHPVVWGAQSIAPTTPGGERWAASGTNAMLPVGGLDWRTAAIYCNWLNNGKSTDRSAFLSGAYDVSTFGYFSSGGGFTDQLTHSPGAQYWIPTLDEWMKAAHYDPNKNGGQGGWWANANQSDDYPIYGPPGRIVQGHATTANAGWNGTTFPGQNPYTVPLGAYNITSAFGLYDTAGGTSEWTEGALGFPGEPYPRDRIFDGSGFGEQAGGSDLARSPSGSNFPSYPGAFLGLRVAAAIPGPGVFAVLGISAGILSRRRRASGPPARTWPRVQIVPIALIAALAGVIGPAALLHAQPDPSGIQFVTVGSPGNAPWTGGGLYTNNRGEVDYSFRIGQYEVTTAQWVEFMNAAFDRPAGDFIPFVNTSAAWSAAFAAETPAPITNRTADSRNSRVAFRYFVPLNLRLTSRRQPAACRSFVSTGDGQIRHKAHRLRWTPQAPAQGVFQFRVCVVPILHRFR